MRILMCHNYYQQPGGEDQVFADERWLMRERGHEVMEYTRHNDDVEHMSSSGKVLATMWNRKTQHDLDKLLQSFQPDIVHCTNTFPLISPSVYAVARKYGARVVQSIHNYRLLCPASTLMRNGSVCEACLGKRFAWPAIQHACYRDNRQASAVVAVYQAMHRLRGTWHTDVDRFIALTPFSRDKLIQGGLPADRISVKANFVYPDPGFGKGGGGYVMFVGRLTEEKGIATLLSAWEADLTLPTLRIVGDGPLCERVRAASQRLPHVVWCGRQTLNQIYEGLDSAEALIVPSLWYEVCPKTILEAFAKGTPVIASRLGGMQEMVADGHTGRLFHPGNAQDLIAAVHDVISISARTPQLRQNARAEYLKNYTADTNYESLLEIYQQTLGQTRSDKSSSRSSVAMPPVSASHA